ncbi:g11267 [Coccomyxa viridis]|uniref:G11267 protein n=1 Tax=Coccomyxa viridis TaxID=1274662 RepID=A0ABP1G7Q9_9CHLO
MAECPLCGSSVPVEQLQAHVDAELQKLDAAASQASSVPSVAIAQHARQAAKGARPAKRALQQKSSTAEGRRCISQAAIRKEKSTGRRQPQQQRAPPARQQGFNHYDNGRGLWDGDMAGLDGLETVGLDCWEGFGTMSMGRL